MNKLTREQLAKSRQTDTLSLSLSLFQLVHKLTDTKPTTCGIWKFSTRDYFLKLLKTEKI